MMKPSGHTCCVCGQPISELDHHAFRDTCAGWKCRTVLFRRLREEQRMAAEQRDRRRDLLEAARTAALQAQGIDPASDCPACALPANCWPLAPLPEARRQRFGEYLRGIIEQALGESGTSPANAPARDEAWTAEPYHGEPAAVLAAACATCGGYCCRHGGERAFLTPVTLRRYRTQHHDASADAIYDAYMSRLGEITYEHACVYQGPAGCTLPRDLRSDPCNGFFCAELARVQQACSQGHPRLFLVAMKGETVVRSGVVSVPAG